MSKDIEWLKEEVKSLRESERGGLVMQGIDIAVANTLYLIDQVEQPNQSNSMDLELPVVPEHVAEDYKALQTYSGVDLAALNYWTRNSALQCTEESHTWLLDQDMVTIANLLRGQFTVEEKKYKVFIGEAYEGVGLFLSKNPHSKEVTLGSNLDYFYHEENNGETHLNEQEIKGYKGGIYWPFALPVEELEE